MKQKVHTACCSIIEERMESLRVQLRELVEGAKNDSKSTAGDKHETARAMMQIEQEKLGNQLNLLEQQQLLLNRLLPDLKSDVVVNGSLVKTNQGWMYVSVPLGKITVDGESVMCLSAQSPLGQKLIGRRSGETVAINAAKFMISEVL